MKSLTIKKIDQKVLDRLHAQAAKEGKSLNAFLRDLLARAVGIRPATGTYDDLRGIAGSWTEEDEREFAENVRPLREIDPTMWD